MAITQVVNDLVDVQFYTALDPYYYVVDNRPLKNLDDNIRLVAAASDAAAGGSNRSALGAAAVAYSVLGYGANVDIFEKAIGRMASTYDYTGFEMFLNHGYMTVRTDQGSGYIEPKLAVHDARHREVLQAGTAYTVQASARPSTSDDRIPSGDSLTQVVDITFKSAIGSTPPPPDAQAICLMKIVIPGGSTEILDEHIELVDLVPISLTADPLGVAKIKYKTHSADLALGATSISLVGSGLTPDSIEEVDVFVQGVNQFNATYNKSANQIILEAPLTEAARVTVRQLSLSA